MSTELLSCGGMLMGRTWCGSGLQGQWRNAVYNGTGAETFAKGSTYRGEYTGGLRNGWGVCRFYNGDYYEGRWAKGLRDGLGMQQVGHDVSAGPGAAARKAHVQRAMSA